MLQARWTGENGTHKNHFSLVLIQEHGMILHILISSPAPYPLIPGPSLTDPKQYIEGFLHCILFVKKEYIERIEKWICKQSFSSVKSKALYQRGRNCDPHGAGEGMKPGDGKGQVQGQSWLRAEPQPNPQLQARLPEAAPLPWAPASSSGQ